MDTEKQFFKWYSENEHRFHCAQMNEKQIAHAAFDEGVRSCVVDTPTCSKCGISWEDDNDIFGCWACGYELPEKYRRNNGRIVD